MAAIQTFAAIDVSSFEMELGIYEISQKNGIRAIDHVRHPIVLGRDVYNALIPTSLPESADAVRILL